MSETEATPEPRQRVRVEQGEKRIRAFLGGEVVADTTRPMLVWEVPYYPTYYFPEGDVRTDLLEAEDRVTHSPSRGDGELFAISAAGKEAPGAALRYSTSPVEELRGLIRLEWDAIDAWFEEDEEVLTHPRNPYTRIDILPSSRHVRVMLAGTTLAETASPTLLFETGLPVRYYLPKPHVNLGLLTPSEKVTHCPYKGRAEHWSVQAGGDLHPDLVWAYPTPLPESQRIAGLLCFYNEKVDVFVDGVLEDRPSTPFG